MPYVKIAIFYSRLFQNKYQNASIINFSKIFFTRIIFCISKIFILLYKKLQFLKFLYKKCNF